MAHGGLKSLTISLVLVCGITLQLQVQEASEFVGNQNDAFRPVQVEPEQDNLFDPLAGSHPIHVPRSSTTHSAVERSSSRFPLTLSVNAPETGFVRTLTNDETGLNHRIEMNFSGRLYLQPGQVECDFNRFTSQLGDLRGSIRYWGVATGSGGGLGHQTYHFDHSLDFEWNGQEVQSRFSARTAKDFYMITGGQFWVRSDKSTIYGFEYVSESKVLRVWIALPRPFSYEERFEHYDIPASHLMSGGANVRSCWFGRVIDAEAGNPVEGAVVGFGGIQKVTDGHGRFSFTEIPAHSYVLEIRHPSFKTYREIVIVDAFDLIHETVVLEKLDLPMRFLDPNPHEDPFYRSLVRRGMVSIDSIVNRDGFEKPAREVIGLAADGVSRILIIAESDVPGTVEFSLNDDKGSLFGMGHLASIDEKVASSDGRAGRTLLYSDTLPTSDGKHAAFAQWVAPSDYARLLDESDKAAAWRPAEITAILRGNDWQVIRENSAVMRIFRPPVLFMHGLWSDAGAWELDILKDNRFTTYAHDYRNTNADPFLSNLVQVSNGISAVLEKTRISHGIAAVQVDVVGHSMGGLLSRLYGADYDRRHPNHGERNYGQGNINRLITLDTPHFGSPLADWLLKDDFDLTGLGNVIQTLYENQRLGQNNCVSCGAVRDLRPGSSILRALPASTIPGHAMVGLGGGSWIEEVQRPFELLSRVWTSPFSTLVTLLLSKGPELVFHIAFQGDEHDLIVSKTSQEGGLEARHATYFPADESGWGIHTSVNKESRINQRLVDLLHEKVSSFSNGFPARRSQPVQTHAVNPVVPAVNHAFMGELEIYVQDGNRSFLVGETAKLIIPKARALSLTRVLLIGERVFQVHEDFQTALEVVISDEYYGEQGLIAVAIGPEGQLWTSPLLPIQVSADSDLVGIEIENKSVFLFPDSPIAFIDVKGVFADGKTRRLSPGQFDLEIDDEAVAIEWGKGRLCGIGSGVTRATARSGAFESVFEVIGLGEWKSQPEMVDVSYSDGTVTLIWEGGLPPFDVESAESMVGKDWKTVGRFNGFRADLFKAQDSKALFFRVVGRQANPDTIGNGKLNSGRAAGPAARPGLRFR